MLRALLIHNPSRFLAGSPNFLTQDEESPGVIIVSDICGRGYFIINDQAHYKVGDSNRNGVQDAGETSGAELVEGGQLLVLFDPVKKKNEKIKK